MTDQYDIPKSKLSRFSKASKTAIKVVGKHAIHKATSSFASKEKKQQKQDQHYESVAKEIFKTLSILKGTALKAAQLMSLELELLPESFQKELKKACYQVPPLNRALVRKVIQSQFEKPPEALFKSFDAEAFAAASIGQVHKATLNKDDRVAVKIQYPGIDKTIHRDIDMLKLLLLKLPVPELKKKKTLISTYLAECQERFLDEADYEKEAHHMTMFYDQNPFENICIPKPRTGYCAKTVLTMDYLEGHHLEELLKQSPTQKEKNQYAQQLWDFFVYFFMNHQLLHADPNPGNYLFMENGKLGVLDFGCIKKCDSEFPVQISQVIQHHIKKDMDPVMEIYNEWGLLPKHLKNDKQQVENYLSFFREWLTLPFREEVFDFAEHPDYMRQRFSAQYKDALHVLHNTTHNFVMFDRAYMGLLNIFQRLKAKVAISFDTCP